MEETKKISEDESKERTFLLGKFHNIEHEVDLIGEQLEEETQSKADALRMLSKFVGDGLAWDEELEFAKLKLQL